MSFLKANGSYLLILGFLGIVWFSILGLNHMLAWQSIYLSFFWFFILIPSYCLPIRWSLPVVIAYGLYVESIYPDLRPLGMITLFSAYLFLMYAKARPFENFYKHLLINASILNLAVLTTFSIPTAFQHGMQGTFWYRLFQDLLVAQIALIVLLPVLGFGILAIIKRQALA